MTHTVMCFGRRSRDLETEINELLITQVRKLKGIETGEEE